MKVTIKDEYTKKLAKDLEKAINNVLPPPKGYKIDKIEIYHKKIRQSKNLRR